MAQDLPRDFSSWISQMNRRVNLLERRPGRGGPRMISAPAPPTGGEWGRGSIVWNSAPTPGGIAGWVCVTGGTPGVWRVFATVAV